MSLHLDFEPHSWYMGFAIRDSRDLNQKTGVYAVKPGTFANWEAFIDNGMTGFVDDLEANTLGALQAKIIAYHLNKHTGHGERIAKKRLEYLRGELRDECISYGELAELASLKEYIEDGDVELLEAAGVPEDNLDDEGYPLCPTYRAKVLPTEDDLCSLCELHSASSLYTDQITGEQRWHSVEQLAIMKESKSN